MSKPKSGPIVINLFGGPGTGKSTTASGLFHRLKLEGYNAELITEYAKDKVWENSLEVLENQLYVFAKQEHRIYRASKHVDWLVVDSPILLTLHYDKSGDLHDLAIKQHNKYRNFNVFLTRVKKYNPAGRTQTEDEARQVDASIKSLLDLNNIEYVTVAADGDAVKHLMAKLHTTRISA